jgi:hypothetical protein
MPYDDRPTGMLGAVLDALAGLAICSLWLACCAVMTLFEVIVLCLRRRDDWGAPTQNPSRAGGRHHGNHH